MPDFNSSFITHFFLVLNLKPEIINKRVINSKWSEHVIDLDACSFDGLKLN